MNGTPTTGALALGQASLARAGQLGAQGMDLRVRALNLLERKRDRMLAEIARIRQDRQIRHAQPDDPLFGGGGGLIGAGVGALLAAPTGGLSMAAGGLIGGALGTGAEQALSGDLRGASATGIGALRSLDLDDLVEVPNPLLGGGPIAAPNYFSAMGRYY